MHVDISRDTFDPANQFLRVIQEQGGVALDADGNEQTAILLARLHQLAADILGPSWGPAGTTGFKVELDPATAKYAVSPGRYYVGGRACEWPKPAKPPEAYPLDGQPDYPKGPAVPDQNQFLFYLDVWERVVREAHAPALREPGLEGVPAAPRTKLVSQVRVFPDKDSAFDQSLLKLAPAATTPAVGAYLDKNGSLPAATEPFVFASRKVTPPGLLRARPIRHPKAEAAPAPAGLENHLYRVEIHRGGKAAEFFGKDIPKDQLKDFATFKWSRENAAAYLPVEKVEAWKDGTARVVLAGSPGEDLLPGVGDWVEYTDDDTALRPRQGDPVGLVPNLFRVAEVTAGAVVALKLEAQTLGAYDPIANRKPAAPALIFWHTHRRTPPVEGRDEKGKPCRPPRSGSLVRADDDALLVLTPPSGAASEDAEHWLPLEADVQVQFTAGTGPGFKVDDPTKPVDVERVFRRGDYWLIPARVSTGAVVWPVEMKKKADGVTEFAAPAAVPPQDGQHGYAPVAAAPNTTTKPAGLRSVLKADEIKKLFTTE